MVHEATTQSFSKDIASGNVVVDFWAPWCGPCRMMAPIFEAESKSNPSIKFVKVNVDDHPDLAQQFGVQGIPTLIYFKNGKVVDTAVGATNQPGLQAKIKQVFG